MPKFYIKVIFLTLLLFCISIPSVFAAAILYTENFNTLTWQVSQTAGTEPCRIASESSANASPDGGNNVVLIRFANSGSCSIIRSLSDYEYISHGKISLWFYDNMDSNNPINIIFNVKTTTNKSIWLGVVQETSTTEYSYRFNDDLNGIASGVTRKFGWRKFEFIIEGGKAWALIDDVSLLPKGSLDVGESVVSELKLSSGWDTGNKNHAARIDGVTVQSGIDTTFNNTGYSVTYNGTLGNLQVSNNASLSSESYLANSFTCTPGNSRCDPDRFEVRFDSDVGPIYGLGMQGSANMLDVKMKEYPDRYEFLDLAFSSGHLNYCGTSDISCLSNAGVNRIYETDIGRMRTPVFVLPKQKMIIAYIQPAIKQLRATKYKTGNRTEFVLKKHTNYKEGVPGKLVIIKANSIPQLYQRYYQMLKNNGFTFKKPNKAAFGLIFETYAEFSINRPVPGGATAETLDLVRQEYENNGLILSNMVFGSGYWKIDPNYACTAATNEFGGIYRFPTIDSLLVKDPALKTYISNMKSTYGINFMLGMRHLATTSSWDIASSSVQGTGEDILGASIGEGSSTFLPGFYSHNNNTGQELCYPVNSQEVCFKVRLLNFNSSKVIGSYIDSLRSAYGNFNGIKEDEMVIHNVKAFRPNDPNLFDGVIGKVYKNYTDKLSNDFVIIGRNDWFGIGTDLVNGQGWVMIRPNTQYGDSTPLHELKYNIDSALTHVVSGYPHTKVEQSIDLSFDNKCASSTLASCNPSAFCAANNTSTPLELTKKYKDCCKINSGLTKYLRGNQLRAFLPNSTTLTHSWHLANSEDIRSFRYFEHLRNRLHQYVYDNAIRWHDTGEPFLMRPLFFDYENDNEVYKLYSSLNPTDSRTPRNQYMFGNALLIRPIFFDNVSDLQVYLPSGKWKPFLQNGPTLSGGRYVRYTLRDSYDFPVYVKEGELFLATDFYNPDLLRAYVFFDTLTTSTLYYTNINGVKHTLVATRNGSTVTITNRTNNRSVTMSTNNNLNGLHTANINTLVGIPNATEMVENGSQILVDSGFLNSRSFHIANFILKSKPTFGTYFVNIDFNEKVDLIDLIKSIN